MKLNKIIMKILTILTKTVFKDVKSISWLKIRWYFSEFTIKIK